MGGVIDKVTDTLFGGSESKQKSKQTAQNLTPQPFQDLASPVSGQIRNLFSTGGGATAPGPYAAGVTGNESQLLNQLQTTLTQPSGTQQQGQNLLSEILTGQQVGAGPSGQPLPGVGTIPGGINTGQENPFLQQAIAAAQRPLLAEFENTIAPALRAQFTQAGQQIQGQGSSPFQQAAADAQGNVLNALGDIAGRLSYQDFAQRQQLGSQEFQQLRELQTQQNLAQRALQSDAYQQERQRQIDALQTSTGVDRAQIENLIAGLEAQALPRLVEQYGIDQGLEEFRRRQGQLLEAIRLGGGFAGPTGVVTGTSTGGSRSSPGLLGGFGQFVGNIES